MGCVKVFTPLIWKSHGGKALEESRVLAEMFVKRLHTYLLLCYIRVKNWENGNVHVCVCIAGRNN